MEKFVLGFVLGAALGAGLALLMSQQQQDQSSLVGSMQGGVRQVVDEAKRAAAQRERELWRDFFTRVPQSDQPSQV